MEPSAGDRPALRSFRDEALLLARLAVPVSAGLFIFRLLGITTLYFIGNLGTDALAAEGIASAVASLTGYSVIIGLAGAMQTLGSQAFGAGNFKMVGDVLQRALCIQFVVCVPIALLWMCSQPVLELLGQSDELAHMASDFLKILAPGLLFNAAMVCLLDWMRAQSLMLPPTIIITVIALLHFPACHLLVNVAGLGLNGAALALTVAHGLELLLMLGYLSISKVHQHTWHGWTSAAFQDWGQFLRLAVPSFFMMAEWWAAEIIVMMAGVLPDGNRAISVMAIFQETNGLVYMLPLGLSVAVATRTGNELGAGNAAAARWAAIVGSVLSVAVTALVAASLMGAGASWIGVFTNDRDVVRLTLLSFAFLAPKTLCDGVQTIAAGVIRGSGRQELGALLMSIAHYCVGVPSAYVLAFPLGLGVNGLCAGLLIAVLTNTVLYCWAIWATDWDYQAQLARDRVQASSIGGGGGGGGGGGRRRCSSSEVQLGMLPSNGVHSQALHRKDGAGRGIVTADAEAPDELEAFRILAERKPVPL